jgi:hypothetical protein
MKKGCLIAAAVVLVLVGGVAGLAGWAFMHFTGGAVGAANTFLHQISDGKIKEAYADSSAVLKAQQTFDQFAAEIHAIGLKDFQSASWPSRKVLPSKAELKGTVRTKQGESLPAEATLLREAGKWRVVAIQLPNRGKPDAVPAPEKAAAPAVPSAEESKALVKKTVGDFADSVGAKDFKGFHDNVAVLWQKQMTPQDMQKAFQVFIDKKVDLSSVHQLEPLLDRNPRIDDRGVLILNGHYDTTPAPLVFEIEYIMEEGVWKCVSLEAKLHDESATSVPAESELKKLVINTLLEFNTAVRVQNFDSFHRQASKALQQAQKPQALQSSFQGFIDNKVDISAVKAATPVFDPAPAIDQQGVLRLNGYFPTTPQVKFKLGYVRESNAWKLLSIGVKRD